jgi:anti-sigma factor RsiW
MLCDQVAEHLPELADVAPDAQYAGTTATLAVELPPEMRAHVETCLRCQAELARYRKLIRALAMLRTRYLEPAPGAMAATLAALSVGAERRAARAVLSGRRLAYAGAIGGTVATAATVAALVARKRRGSALGAA